jgi:uncharacterized protein YbjT (DUF2867 family)
MSSYPTVFVSGATGSQGGAIVRRLLVLGWNVRAVVRNLDTPKAEALKAAGVHLTEGDWDNVAALTTSIAGCAKLFLCLLPNFADLTWEYRQSQRILEIAKDAGVEQVVASTSLGVSQLEAQLFETKNSFMKKHLQAKKMIEQAVVDAGFVSHTFLRPGFLMANFIEPKVSRYPEIREKGTWTTAMAADTLLPLLDHEDIGMIAAVAFQDPAKFNGKALALGSEMLTVQQTLDQLSKATGRQESFKAIFMTDEEIEAQVNSSVLINSEKAMRAAADYVDLTELSRIGPLTTFEEFLRRELDGVRKTYPLNRV